MIPRSSTRGRRVNDGNGLAGWLQKYGVLVSASIVLIGAVYTWITTELEARDVRLTEIEASVRSVRAQNTAVAQLLDYVILGFCDPAQRTSVELRSLLECQRRSIRYGIPVDTVLRRP